MPDELVLNPVEHFIKKDKQNRAFGLKLGRWLVIGQKMANDIDHLIPEGYSNPIQDEVNLVEDAILCVNGYSRSQLARVQIESKKDDDNQR